MHWHHRSMSLWQHDRTFIEALEICQEYLAPIDVLSYLWPCSGMVLFLRSEFSDFLTTNCPAQRLRYMALREKLADASTAAGIAPPPPPKFSIPSQPVM